MRLLLVVCVAVLVGVFLVVAWSALLPSCHHFIVDVNGAWCLPASGVA